MEHDRVGETPHDGADSELTGEVSTGEAWVSAETAIPKKHRVDEPGAQNAEGLEGNTRATAHSGDSNDGRAFVEQDAVWSTRSDADATDDPAVDQAAADPAENDTLTNGALGQPERLTSTPSPGTPQTGNAGNAYGGVVSAAGADDLTAAQPTRAAPQFDDQASHQSIFEPPEVPDFDVEPTFTSGTEVRPKGSHSTGPQGLDAERVTEEPGPGAADRPVQEEGAPPASKTGQQLTTDGETAQRDTHDGSDEATSSKPSLDPVTKTVGQQDSPSDQSDAPDLTSGDEVAPGSHGTANTVDPTETATPRVDDTPPSDDRDSSIGNVDDGTPASGVGEDDTVAQDDALVTEGASTTGEDTNTPSSVVGDTAKPNEETNAGDTSAGDRTGAPEIGDDANVAPTEDQTTNEGTEATDPQGGDAPATEGDPTTDVTGSKDGTESSDPTGSDATDTAPVTEAPSNAAPAGLHLTAERPDMPLDLPAPGDTVTLDVRLAGEAYRGDPRYEIVVDGQVVAKGEVDWSRETTTEGRYNLKSGRDEVEWRDVSVDLEMPAGGFDSVEVRFPNDKYRRNVGDRNLIVDQISLDGHVIQAESTEVHYQGGHFKGDTTSERMPWKGSLEFDVSDAFSGAVPLEAPEGPYVLEDTPGAVIGTLDFTDADVGDHHTLAVSDDRFEIQDGVLKLKDGVALDYETAQSVSLDVTVTDEAGATDHLTVDLSVVDTPEVPAPEIAVEHSFVAKFFDVNHRVRTLDDIDYTADPTHVDAINDVNFEKSRGSFWEDGAKDTFGAQITGQIDVPEDGVFTFTMGSDDGSSLLIDGVPVIDNDRLHPFRSQQGEIELDAGPHTIEVLYFENRGHAGLTLEWEGPGLDGKGLVTPAQNTEQPEGIEGEAFAFSVDLTCAGGVESVELSDLPEGALIEVGGQSFVVGDDPVDLTGVDVSVLSITPPPEFQGSIDATLSATDLHGNTTDMSLGFDVVAPPWEPNNESVPSMTDDIEFFEQMSQANTGGADAGEGTDGAADLLDANIEINADDTPESDTDAGALIDL